MRYIYLDYAATTPVDPRVWERMGAIAHHHYGNPSSLHCFGEEAEEIMERSKQTILQLIGSKGGNVVLTSGGTEANNLAIKGVAHKYAAQGKHVVVSAIEHEATLAACAALERDGFQVSRLPVNRHGEVDVEALAAAIRPETILVSVMHANNEVGTIQPVETIGQIIKAKRESFGRNTPFFHCDAVQTAGQLELEVDRWGIDLLSLSAHKFYAPKGVGALYVRKGIRLLPLLDGGGQEYGWRSGTQNVAGLAGMAYALQLCREGQETEQQRYLSLRAAITRYLKQKEEVFLTVPDHLALATHIHFRCNRIEGQVIMQELSRRGIAISTSSACHARHHQPSHVMLAMGYTEEEARQAVRISLGRFVTSQDVEEFLAHLDDVLYTIGQHAAL